MNQKATPQTSAPARTTQSHYDYDQVLQWLEKKGIESFGPAFKITDQDKPIWLKMAAYFLQDATACAAEGINLSKGILLSGPVGTGKTTMMALIKAVAGKGKKYFIKPCRDVSFEFIRDGYSVIDRYAHGRLSGTAGNNICFDDLGAESSLKYYGNECNVMAEIILSRYDLFISKKITTHLTTNLSASEIETHYGNRVRSRLRELCNLIAFDSTTGDKRR